MYDSGDDDAGSIINYPSDDSFVAAVRPASLTSVERSEEGAWVDDTASGKDTEFPFIKSNANILVEQAPVLMKSTWYSRAGRSRSICFRGARSSSNTRR